MKKIIFKEDENNTIIITGTASEAEALSIFLGAITLRRDENEKTRN
jgi:hypothetical protein